MACKYYHNNVEYSSKEEFINKVIKPNFINNDKILRIQEFQQPDFLKQIRNNPNWINEQNFSETEKGFLNLLFGKNEGWVKFGISALIQNAAKEGYTKVRLPTGNTSAKVEGHSTLEEFKKQKEDRIKELESSKKTEEIWTIEDFEEEEKHTFGSEKEANEWRNSQPFPDQWYKPYKNEKQQKSIEQIDNEINQLKQELERVEGPEGFGALKPIYKFYENTVANILKKQGLNPVLVTDEYGNTWNEVTVNQFRDLSNILLQRNEANQIIGQANIKAMSVLIDAINQKQDTLPHEYAHHYIAWYRDTPIVQKAIEKWGSEEALVQSIGEQVIKQKGEAYDWWNKFVKWIMNRFNSLSKLQKEELTQILTDAFLNREDLNSIGNTENPQYVNTIQPVITFNTDYLPNDNDVKPGVEELFQENPDFASKIYEALGFTVNISDEQKQQQQTDPLENKDLKDNKNLNTIESVINQIKDCKS